MINIGKHINYTTTEEEAVVWALTLCRGCYQRGIVKGRYHLSGGDLRGEAAKWSGCYQRSRDGLFERLDKAGVPWHEEVGSHGLRVLVLGNEKRRSR